MDHKKYLADEVIEDYADGLIPRREALRRLLLMGLTATSSTALLAACAREEEPEGSPQAKPPEASPTSSPSPTATGTPAVPTEAITFPGSSGTLQGAWATAATPRGWSL